MNIIQELELIYEANYMMGPRGMYSAQNMQANLNAINQIMNRFESVVQQCKSLGIELPNALYTLLENYGSEMQRTGTYKDFPSVFKNDRSKFQILKELNIMEQNLLNQKTTETNTQASAVSQLINILKSFERM